MSNVLPALALSCLCFLGSLTMPLVYLVRVGSVNDLVQVVTKRCHVSQAQGDVTEEAGYFEEGAPVPPVHEPHGVSERVRELQSRPRAGVGSLFRVMCSIMCHVLSVALYGCVGLFQLPV